MPSVSAIELKVGNLIRYKNSMYRVVSTEHVKPGKGGAFIQAELKDIKSGTKLNDRFRSDQVVEKIMFESKKSQYLYKNGDDLEFMDLESYEQFTLPASMLSGPVEFLVENMELMVDYADGEIVSATLPQNVVCKIKETQPYIKGQTVKASFKPALLENGLTVQVPDFIESGEEIVVSTVSMEYMERAK
jgi:elongation factor P